MIGVRVTQGEFRDGFGTLHFLARFVPFVVRLLLGVHSGSFSLLAGFPTGVMFGARLLRTGQRKAARPIR